MTKSSEVVIRAFDGSLADAEGLLAVERATFDESPYSPDQVRTMLTQGPQRAWLAVGGGEVVGFAIAFRTSGLRGRLWEIDLLAVLPAWRGRRLAIRLIRAAAAGGVGAARLARAVVATDNHASLRAFSRAGFQTGQEIHKLLIYQVKDQLPRRWSPSEVTIREATSAAEGLDWLEACVATGNRATGRTGQVGGTGQAPQAVPGPDLSSLEDHPGPTLLLAGQDGQPAGYVELIQVETLLYRGLWLESLVAPNRSVREALVQGAMDRTRTAGLDELGSVVPESHGRLSRALLAAGFRSLGDFYMLRAELPLPQSTSPLPAGGMAQPSLRLEGKKPVDGHV